MFTRTDLSTLTDAAESPAVSIFLPTHVRGRDIEQDPIRLKNLLGEAQERLIADGMRRPDAVALLAPASALLDDYEFWRHQDEGLAVFVAPGVSHLHKVPTALPELAVVGRRFHVKPLLPVLAADGTFFVATITASQARLFEGSRHTLCAIEDADLPEGVYEIEDETQYENMLHSSPVARPRSGAPGGIPKTHNFGETPEEMRKAQLIEYLRRTASAIDGRLPGSQSPLVLIAEPEIDGNFRAVATPKNLLEDGVRANPDALSEDEIHRRAYDVVRPIFERGREAALDRFRSLIGEGQSKAAAEIEPVVQAAHEGRVDTLFLAEGETLRGRYNPDDRRVTMQDDGEDLLDLAAAQTLRHAGKVYILPKAELPESTPVAALFRY